MTHGDTVENYPGTLADLARAVSDLKYDALAEFLNALAAKLGADSIADEARGRPKLAAALHGAAAGATTAGGEISRAWAICAPRM